jgi:hypothetical protein
MIRSLAFLLAASGPVSAETARVYSGEHGGFTRLVVEIPAETEWTVGRTKEGYAFAVRQGAQLDYDLSGVWQRISRTRVSALQVDPETGALLLSLACDCHVFPFEYQAGSIVLDVKPGQPPAGSAFEAPFEGTTLEAAGDELAKATSAASYNWLTDVPASSVQFPTTVPLPLATGEVSLDPLRDALLERLARGAADGIVDMGRVMPKRREIGPQPEDLPWSTVKLGEQPGVRVTDPDAFVPGAGPAGSCPAEGLLDIASWGGSGSPLDLLAAARSGLYGEFDVADPESVLRSVRSHLFLGFGAEAAQLADLGTAAGGDEVMALYRSMARTLDGNTDPGTPFAKMLDCDGPAALWAALARDRLPPGKGVNREAVLRSFLALPAHLRAQLGKSLAEKFLALDDQDAVRTIRDAMERTPNIDAAAVALLDAERELQQGNADAAQTHAEEVVSLEGNGAEGLVALVEAHFQKHAPIGPEVAEALRSGRGEASGTEMAIEVERAIVLSLALSGQVDAAFQHEGAEGDTLVDLWDVVQSLADDDDFLRHAVLPAGASAPNVASDLSLQVSRRLLSLGFPDAAMTWIGSVRPDDAFDRRLVAAEAALDLGDARLSVDLLAGLARPEADEIRAQALLQIGDLAAAEHALAASGQTEAASRTTLWERDWTSLDPATPEIWQSAASLTQSVEQDTESGLLGRGAQAVEASVTSREAIEALLTSVAAPEVE